MQNLIENTSKWITGKILVGKMHALKIMKMSLKFDTTFIELKHKKPIKLSKPKVIDCWTIFGLHFMKSEQYIKWGKIVFKL